METTVEEALKTVLSNPQNLASFKSRILAYGDEEEVREALYEVVTDLQGGRKVKETFKRLALRELGFQGRGFERQRQEQKEEDDFITNPAEVEEGVHECDCGSKRTLSFTLQTRGGDEATSVWAQCVECGKRWRA